MRLPAHVIDFIQHTHTFKEYVDALQEKVCDLLCKLFKQPCVPLQQKEELGELLQS